jgi:hypothetical protein
MEQIELSGDEFVDLLNTMPDGMAVRIDNDEENEENHVVTKETFAEIFELGKNLVMFHLISLMNRVGVPEFMAEVEHTYFPPLTPTNDQFIMRWVKWNDMLWTITSVPMESSKCFFDVAPKYGFNINPGSPVMLGSGLNMTYQSSIHGIPASCFPLKGDNVYVIEGGTGIR